LSGGGHRACVFALGALLYLAEARKTKDVASIASVSGGSLANGVIAQEVDLAASSADEVERVVARTARLVTGPGTLFRYRPVVVYLAVMAIAFLAALFVPWFLPLDVGWRVLIFVGAVAAAGWLASLRGRVAARGFGSTLFERDGRRTLLREIHRGVDHVICATDLHAGEHVYFSSRFVYAYRFGLGQPGETRLETVVQASAAFPPVFPVTRVRTSGLSFAGGRKEARGTRSLVLHDGGVYDNMGDQWAQGLADRAGRDEAKDAEFMEADELVVVNASAGMPFSRVRRLGVPILGELLTLLLDKTVLYDNGNSVRRRELIARFDLADRERRGLRGALVHIEQSPFKVPDVFAEAGDRWPERAARAARAQELLLEGRPDEPAAREAWAEVAQQNADVPTTLVGFDAERTARLLHHAYVLAMVNLHVILGYPLLELPTRDRFSALLDA
jgi:predicted acylesterase/phospholipase RssA